MNIGKNIIKFRRNVRAISPVIATLLMIAIAVVASLVVYAWVSGYMNFQTDKTGKSVVIQATNIDADGKLNVYVQNVGQGVATISTVYINGTLSANVDYDPSSIINEESTTLLTVTPTTPYVSTDNMAIKVVTDDGTYMTYTRNP